MLRANVSIIGIIHGIQLESSDLELSGDGVLSVGRMSSFLVFSWRQYPKKKEVVAPGLHNYKIIHARDLNGISVEFQGSGGCHVYFQIANGSVESFWLSKDKSHQMTSFIHLLVIDSVNDQTVSVDRIQYWLDWSLQHASSCLIEHKKLDIVVRDLELVFPDSLEIPKPDLGTIDEEAYVADICRLFGVDGDRMVNSPCDEECLMQCTCYESLRQKVVSHGMDPNVRWKWWPVILDVLPFDSTRRKEVLQQRVKEYLEVKAQWKSMTLWMHMKYSTTIVTMFMVIKNDIIRTHLSAESRVNDNWRETLTSILRTATMWNGDVMYAQGMNDIGLCIMEVIYPGTVNSAYTYDEYEALSFWCLASFIEKIRSGLIPKLIADIQKAELSEIMRIVKDVQPDCAKWFESHDLANLSFLIEPYMMACNRAFRASAVTRLWESAFCCETPTWFVTYLCAAVLILSFISVTKMEDHGPGFMVQTINALIARQAVGNVIGLTLALLKRRPPARRATPLVMAVDFDTLSSMFSVDKESLNTYQDCFM